MEVTERSLCIAILPFSCICGDVFNTVVNKWIRFGVLINLGTVLSFNLLTLLGWTSICLFLHCTCLREQGLCDQ